MQEVINFNLLKEYDKELRTVSNIWAKEKSYNIDDTVQYKGNYIKCITTGTSGTNTLDFTGLDIGDTLTDGTVTWEIINPPSSGEGTSIKEWESNTSYTVGENLVYDGTVYKVTTDFTSGGTFDDTNLEEYIAQKMKGATSSQDGKSGLVPQPTTNDISKFLCGDGTWKNAGGSSLNVGRTILWEGIGYQTNQVLNLSDDYTDYDYIVVYLRESTSIDASTIMPVIAGIDFIDVGQNTGTLYRAGIKLSTNTAKLEIANNLSSSGRFLGRIEGIKLINPNTYSTTEEEIGTWIDGKPLYQKTFTGTFGTVSDFNSLLREEQYDLSSYNISEIVEINYLAQNATNKSSVYIGHGFSASGSLDRRGVLHFEAEVNPADDKLYLYSQIGKWYSDLSYVITIKYTKTTD